MPKRGRSATPSPNLAVLCEEIKEREPNSPEPDEAKPPTSPPGINIPLTARQIPTKSTAISMMEYCNREEIEITDYTWESTELCQRVTFQMHNLTDWSKHMTYIDADFLNCQKALVVFATADFKMTTLLLVTIEREKGRRSSYLITEDEASRHYASDNYNEERICFLPYGENE